MSEEKTLEQVLWDSADAMRGNMGAGNYMNYALGLIFYKYLSDVTLERAADTLIRYNGDDPATLQTLDQWQDAYAKAYNDPDIQEDLLAHLFGSVNLQSTQLGPTPQKRNDVISSVMTALGKLNLGSHQGDLLGDAYEYLIANFASDTGKKAGEFYTPQPVATLLTKIAAYGQEDLQSFTIYEMQIPVLIKELSAPQILKIA